MAGLGGCDPVRFPVEIVIFHITARTAWEAAQSQPAYAPGSLGSQGFIHCSTIEQVIDTANRLYRGRSDLVLLCIDESLLESVIRYEQGEPGQYLPHVYGAVNLDAVRHALDFRPNEDGTFTLPASVSQSEN